jgi:23S rRNA pseudouridine1911/1915/1917 synthase
MESRSLPVPDGLDGDRADAGIARMLGLSRTIVADACDAGTVELDGVVIKKSDKLRAGGWLTVSWQGQRELVIEPVVIDGMSILFDDDDFVVVDKPVGVAAHPASSWHGPTVLGGLAAAGYRISTSGAPERAGIVHRLDVGTSGAMVVAKSEIGYERLKRAFHDRQVTKVYHAVVQGQMDPLAGTIDAPVGRHPSSDWKFAVTSAGKHAVTHYETLEAFAGASLLEVQLETGRTHQIRVHMAAQRHPCVGDTLYGADPTLSAKLDLTRQWLHAHKLGFEHPTTGEWVEFVSNYPPDLEHALDILRAGFSRA